MFDCMNRKLLGWFDRIFGYNNNTGHALSRAVMFKIVSKCQNVNILFEILWFEDRLFTEQLMLRVSNCCCKTSASVLDEISMRSTRKLSILISKKHVFRIKISKTQSIEFWKRKQCSRHSAIGTVSWTLLPFSEFNRLRFGYFDPENVFFGN